MSGTAEALTEKCREASNALGLKTKIIFAEFPSECNGNYNSIARNKLPTAYFITAGRCRIDSGVSVTNFDLMEVASLALPYAEEKAYIVFEFVDTRHFPAIAAPGLKEFMQNLHRSMHLTPVIINYHPLHFMNYTQLYYDDVVLMHRTTRNARTYAEIIDSINRDVLPAYDEQPDILNINAKLGNGPLVHTKPLLFSKTAWQIADTMFLGLMLYSMYKLYTHSKKSNKHKLG